MIGCSKATVSSAFLSYLEGSSRWRTKVEWQRHPHYEQIRSRPDGFVDTEATPQIDAEWGVSAADLPVLAIFDDGILQRVLLRVRSADNVPRELTDDHSDGS